MTTVGPAGEGSRWATSSDRLQTFSDAVFAIALTLLVLELPAPETGRFTEDLTHDWPVYLAYVTAFLTIGDIWLDHHAVFSRVTTVEFGTVVLNLGLLLGTALIPWPTSLIAASISSGDRSDQIASIAVWVITTAIVTLPWVALNLRLARQPELLQHPGSAGWLRRNARFSALNLPIVGAGMAIAILSPVAALLLFLVTPVLLLVLNARIAFRRSKGTP